MQLVLTFKAKVNGESKQNEIDDKRRIWRKLYVAVETSTHEIIVVELSLSTLTDGVVFPNLLKQIRRSILEVSGNGVYEMRACHAAIKVKGAIALVLPREGEGFLGPWSPSTYRRGFLEVIRLK
ncbi:hypothetical protein VCHA28FP16_270014 [Vibrio chagasii]|nr:hypothetical protein VCHA28FP16_270014 [Vibrio chagasii]